MCIWKIPQNNLFIFKMICFQLESLLNHISTILVINLHVGNKDLKIEPKGSKHIKRKLKTNIILQLRG